jgi:hypothetical protein
MPVFLVVTLIWTTAQPEVIRAVIIVCLVEKNMPLPMTELLILNLIRHAVDFLDNITYLCRMFNIKIK